MKELVLTRHNNHVVISILNEDRKSFSIPPTTWSYQHFYNYKLSKNDSDLLFIRVIKSDGYAVYVAENPYDLNMKISSNGVIDRSPRVMYSYTSDGKLISDVTVDEFEGVAGTLILLHESNPCSAEPSIPGGKPLGHFDHVAVMRQWHTTYEMHYHIMEYNFHTIAGQRAGQDHYKKFQKFLKSKSEKEDEYKTSDRVDSIAKIAEQNNVSDNEAELRFKIELTKVQILSLANKYSCIYHSNELKKMLQECFEVFNTSSTLNHVNFSILFSELFEKFLIMDIMPCFEVLVWLDQIKDVGLNNLIHIIQVLLIQQSIKYNPANFSNEALCYYKEHKLSDIMFRRCSNNHLADFILFNEQICNITNASASVAQDSTVSASGSILSSEEKQHQPFNQLVSDKQKHKHKHRSSKKGKSRTKQKDEEDIDEFLVQNVPIYIQEATGSSNHSLKEILQLVANDPSQIASKIIDKPTVLMLAVRKPDVDKSVIEYLLKHTGDAITHKDGLGNTVLHDVVQYRDLSSPATLEIFASIFFEYKLIFEEQFVKFISNSATVNYNPLISAFKNYQGNTFLHLLFAKIKKPNLLLDYLNVIIPALDQNLLLNVVSPLLVANNDAGKNAFWLFLDKLDAEGHDPGVDKLWPQPYREIYKKFEGYYTILAEKFCYNPLLIVSRACGDDYTRFVNYDADTVLRRCFFLATPKSLGTACAIIDRLEKIHTMVLLKPDLPKSGLLSFYFSECTFPSRSTITTRFLLKIHDEEAKIKRIAHNLIGCTLRYSPLIAIIYYLQVYTPLFLSEDQQTVRNSLNIAKIIFSKYKENHSIFNNKNYNLWDNFAGSLIAVILRINKMPEFRSDVRELLLMLQFSVQKYVTAMSASDSPNLLFLDLYNMCVTSDTPAELQKVVLLSVINGLAANSNINIKNIWNWSIVISETMKNVLFARIDELLNLRPELNEAEVIKSGQIRPRLVH